MPAEIKKIAYVYKITNPIGQVYVGSTTDFNRRIKEYKGAQCKAQKKIYESILAYGWNNHTAQVIWVGDINERFKKEDELGMELNALESNGGLNIFLPFHCPPLSQEARDKVSKNNKRAKPSKETQKKSIATTGRAIIQYSEIGEKINEFNTTAEAARITGIGRTSIKNCLNKYGSELAGGYRWEFKNPPTYANSSKKVVQIDTEGNEIAIFNSMAAAGRHFGIHATSIRFAICRGGKTAAGYRWKFKNIV